MSKLLVYGTAILLFTLFAFGIYDIFMTVRRIGEDITSNTAILSSSAARLAALEASKAPATARRFTTDDAQALMRCLRIPYAERAPCLDALNDRIERRP